MAITYDAGSNTITVTGYTELVPCTFEDVYQADVSGGWGVVTKQGVQYLVDCRLVIGDRSTTTWFIDTFKQVQFLGTAISVNQQILIEVKDYGNFRLGEIASVANKTGKKGCSILFTFSGYYPVMMKVTGENGVFELYDSNFTSTTNLRAETTCTGRQGKIYECTFLNILAITGNLDCHRVTISTPDRGVYANVEGAIYDDLFIHDNTRYGAIFLFSGLPDCAPRNLKVRNVTAIARMHMGGAYDQSLINADADEWVISWSGSGTPKLFRKYEFDLKVVDQDGVAIQGATVTLYDKDENQVFQVTTDAQGEISTQTVSHGYFNQANGSTEQLYSPFRLTVTKAGYANEEVQNIVLDEQTKLQVGMYPPVYVPRGGAPAVKPKRGLMEIPALITTVDGHLLLNINRNRPDYLLLI